MNRRAIGLVLFWLGIAGVVVMQALTWFQSPMQRLHEAEELRGTIYAVDGVVWWLRMIATSGLTLSITGVLISTTEKGSYFWLLGILPATAISIGMFWAPTQYAPQLFGIGGDRNPRFVLRNPVDMEPDLLRVSRPGQDRQEYPTPGLFLPRFDGPATMFILWKPEHPGTGRLSNTQSPQYQCHLEPCHVASLRG